jgi:hypothetical protein
MCSKCYLATLFNSKENSFLSINFYAKCYLNVLVNLAFLDAVYPLVSFVNLGRDELSS